MIFSKLTMNDAYVTGIGVLLISLRSFLWPLVQVWHRSTAAVLTNFLINETQTWRRSKYLNVRIEIITHKVINNRGKLDWVIREMTTQHSWIIKEVWRLKCTFNSAKFLFFSSPNLPFKDVSFTSSPSNWFRNILTNDHDRSWPLLILVSISHY